MVGSLNADRVSDVSHRTEYTLERRQARQVSDDASMLDCRGLMSRTYKYDATDSTEAMPLYGADLARYRIYTRRKEKLDF